MKNLTANITTKKNSSGVSPINIFSIDWGGSIGTKYYSDQSITTPVIALGVVIDWGNFQESIVEDSGNYGSLKIQICDPTLTFLTDTRTQEVSKCVCYLYQYFIGLTLVADMTVLLKGVVKSFRWEESTTTASIEIENTQAAFTAKVGTKITKELFPRIRKEDDGKTIPLVYGTAEKGEIVQVIDAYKTTLSTPLSASGNYCVVTDARDFPQGTPISLDILRERVRGRFSGNKLTLLSRGCVVATGTTSYAPTYRTFQANLTPQGPHWIGFNIRFRVGSNYHEAKITNYTSPNIYAFDPPTLWGTLPFASTTVPFEIYGAQTSHDSGETILEVINNYTWILNDAPSTSIQSINVAASIVVSGSSVSDKLKNLETQVALPTDYYTINLDDNTFVTELGHNVTTLTMKFNIFNLPDTPYTGKLSPKLTGIPISNPAAIIKDIATKIGFTYPTDFDTTSYATVYAATSWLALGFSVQETRKGIELLYDIAFQSRILLHWEQGKLKFEYLENKKGTTVTTIANTTREIDELEVTRQSKDVIVNKIHVKFTEKGVVNELVIQDTTSIASYGEQRKDLVFWAHNQRQSVLAIGTFWLQRWLCAQEIVTITTFLTSLELENHDWVDITVPSIYTSQPAQITQMETIPGDKSKPDRIKMTLLVPTFPGCASNCELKGETGCVSVCQYTCQTGCEASCNFSCESVCQTACQLICVLSCELECTTFRQVCGSCQATCTSNCRSACETSCRSGGCQTNGCTSSCTSNCQSGPCETGCVVGCQTGCENACQVGGCESSGCQFSNETGCQTGCEATCESSCRSGCQDTCETACQGFCQSNCESSCTTGCEATCQTSCQTSCEGSCVLTCMTGCRVSCQTSCEVSCQTSCESGCQTGCETSCVVGCQTSCEVICQTSCETSCEWACTIACETSCESGCQSGCEPTCESSCQSCCQWSCTGSCEDACQKSCTTTCTTDCQQLGCQNQCTVACESNCRGMCEHSCQQCCMFLGAEIWSGCTSQCQTSCQQSCQTDCQSICEQNAMGGGGNVCLTSCQASCMTSATTGCGEYCTVGCQCYCQLDCQSSCRTTSCMTQCECTCQSSDTTTGMCSTSNEGACYSACQGYQQTGCQTSCETGCQAQCVSVGEQTGCNLYCTVGCQCYCQLDCQSSCRTTSCMTQCECTCQSSDTTTGMCSTSNEGACYTSCQGVIQTSCNTSCQTGCQAFCMTSSAQVSCTYYCTYGCRCSCQSICQSSCRTGCESTCTCGPCQTSIQFCNGGCTSNTQSCQTACRESCTNSCRNICQTSCMTNCATACQAFCMTGGAQTGCTLYCTYGCRCTCQSVCQSNCRTACDGICQCGPCQTSSQFCNGGCTSGGGINALLCATTCMESCTTVCTDSCQTACMTNCATACQAFCMTSSAQTGCTYYCTVGCRCTCQSVCQSNCRTGCEVTCTCGCQTAAQT